MEKREILQQLIDHYANGNKTAFGRLIGISPQAVKNALDNNTLNVERILTYCENVNPAFVMNGDLPITLESGVSSPAPSEEDKKNEKLINELLTVCHVLTEERNALRRDMEDVKAILRKSQEQFDRVLDLVERLSVTHPPYGGYMAAEPELTEK